MTLIPATIITGFLGAGKTTLAQALAQALHMESLGRLAAGIAHEINTPMQYVQNNVAFFADAFEQLRPLLLSLKAWGEKWGGFAPRAKPALTLVHRSCGHPAHLRLVCPSCNEPFGPRDVNVRLGTGFAAERQARRARA